MRTFVASIFITISVTVFAGLCQVDAQPAPCTGLASIHGQDTICAGGYVILSDSTTGGTWSSSDTTKAIVNAATGSVTGIFGGSATITYTLSPGCFVTKLIVVNPLLLITGDSAVCAGSSVFFSDLTTGGSWTSNNASVASIDPSTGIGYGVASGVTVITYTLANGCHREKTLQVNSLPLNYFVFGGGIYCEGTSGVTIGLDGSDTGINYKLYRNDTAVGDSLDGTGSAIFFGPIAIPGLYSIIAFNVHTGCSKQMSDVATVGIIPAVVPHVTITSSTGNDTVCIAAAATFTATPVNGGPSPGYNWYVNGTSVGGGNTYSYVPNNGDVLYVVLHSTAVCALPGSVDTSIIVTTIPRQVPAVSISVAPSDTVCLYVPVSLTATPVFGGPSPTYRWVKNGITATIATAYSYMPANGDLLQAVIYSDYQCLLVDSTYSNGINITVQPLLIPTVSIAAHPGTIIGVGQYDTLTTSVINGGTHLHYQWAINNSPVPGATADTFISNAIADQDTVACIVTSPDFCGGLPEIVSLVITDTLIPILGITGATGSDNVWLVPNPNNGTFVVDGKFAIDRQKATLEVVNLLGQVVYSDIVPLYRGALKTTVNVGKDLPGGVYIVRISAGEAVVVKRVVVSR